MDVSQPASEPQASLFSKTIQGAEVGFPSSINRRAGVIERGVREGERRKEAVTPFLHWPDRIKAFDPNKHASVN